MDNVFEGLRALLVVPFVSLAASLERTTTVSRNKQPVECLDALCAYEECRFCVHRVNACKTPDKVGQCNLELEDRATVPMCRGDLFFRLAPDHAARYRHWILSGSPRAKLSQPAVGEIPA